MMHCVCESLLISFFFSVFDAHELSRSVFSVLYTWPKMLSVLCKWKFMGFILYYIL